MEVDITTAQARELLSSPGFDAYGKVRIYGQLEGGGLVAIKSVYHLEHYALTRVYTVVNNGYTPIRKAS